MQRIIRLIITVEAETRDDRYGGKDRIGYGSGDRGD